ncbi:MAG: D-glycero-beta-D-manno-heptose 1-phosphate adenylyltransferase [Deltaproteobacteria bacterium]|nr:D-glycero-beta-D-manno-heptose 1-phosphate adenylyltransferase [Deltaproteobacteria bacterium]
MKRATAYQDKVGSLARVRARLRKARRDGKRIVFTNGCFDLLHPGHVRYLAAARARGDALVVAVNSDRSVRGLKGPGRPVQTEAARAEVLAALEAVDHVVIFDAPTPLEVIVALEPDVLAKGADWALEDIVGAKEVRARGGKVERIPLVQGQSTTRLIERSAKSPGEAKASARKGKARASKRADEAGGAARRSGRGAGRGT